MFPKPKAHGRRDMLDQHLSPEEIVAYEPMGEREWARVRWRGLYRLLRHFVDWRNLRFHRGFFPEIAGYAWGGIYRSMMVPAIAAASFRNEGHFRPKGRISGTESFFSAALRYPRNSPALREALRVVNLRHHVAGVASREGDDVKVLPHYEAAFAYVSTAFIESLRRGYAAHGVAPESKRGRSIGEDLCTIFYQVAGMAGLRRMPRDLAAHEKFRDSFDEHLRSLSRSQWMAKRARELAKRIFPFTAALAGIPLEDQLHRYLDPETAAYLVPDPAELEEMRPVYDELLSRFGERHRGYSLGLFKQLFNFRPPPVDDPRDLEPLWNAYRECVDESVDARLIGAILLHAIEERSRGGYWHVPVTLRFEEGEPLIRQGEKPKYCYILLDSRRPLSVTRRGVPGKDRDDEVEIARIEAPAVLGEIGMWRGTAAMATVSCHGEEELRVVRLGHHEFDSLKSTPGFWSAAAAEVQRRLRVSMQASEKFLGEYEERVHDPELMPLLLLLRYVNGDSDVNLDLVPEIHPDSSLADCIDLLHDMATKLLASRTDDPSLRVELENLLQVIG